MAPYRAPNGKAYEARVGSRVQVKRGKAYQTSGGLLSGDIIVNANGRYVSAKKSAWGKKHGSKRLAEAGYGLFRPGGVGTVTPVRGARRRTTSRR